MGKSLITTIIFMTFLLLGDQGMKYWVRINIPLHQSSVILPNLLDMTHVENRGVSYSFLGDIQDGFRVPLLISISLIAISGLGYYWWRYKKNLNFFSNLAFIFILPGAIGNLIDRAIYGTVTDYFHFRFYSTSFFVNNIADILISAGVVAYLLGMWNEAKVKQ